MDYYVLTFVFLSCVQFSLEKSIDRYKAYTKGNANNNTVQEDIQVIFRIWIWWLIKTWIMHAHYVNIYETDFSLK
jgi:hypothetical protein